VISTWAAAAAGCLAAAAAVISTWAATAAV